MTADTAVAEPEAVAEAPAAEAPAKPKRAKKERTGISVALAPALRTKLEEEAKAANQTVRVYVAQKLHTEYGIAMPEPRTRTAYSTPDEKKAASKARRMKRADLVRSLLAKHAAEQAAAGTSAEAPTA